MAFPSCLLFPPYIGTIHVPFLFILRLYWCFVTALLRKTVYHSASSLCLGYPPPPSSLAADGQAPGAERKGLLKAGRRGRALTRT